MALFHPPLRAGFGTKVLDADGSRDRQFGCLVPIMIVVVRVKSDGKWGKFLRSV